MAVTQLINLYIVSSAIISMQADYIWTKLALSDDRKKLNVSCESDT